MADHRPRLTAVFASALLAAACAGDGATPTTVETTVPGTPTTSAGPVPSLPSVPLSYSDAENPLPTHFVAGPGGPGPGPVAPGSVALLDNTPASNPITNAGATLGRVLFYDRRLSANDQVSCGSCHLQSAGFADTAQFSRGFRGGRTGRHSMALTNARFFQGGRFFWDERAATLEAQVLQPIQDTVEMGMTLDALERKLAATSFYPALFRSAFGTPDVTRDRISRALAQFVRSMVSTQSTFDRAFQGGAQPNLALLSPEAQRGQQLFVGQGACARCHATATQSIETARNTGLDATTTDAGAGGGRFKAPTLRNVATRTRFMHDGRFTSLAQVVEFYNSGVQPNPDLDARLRLPPAPGLAPGVVHPTRLNLSEADKRALVTFLGTLTDSTFLRDVRFSDPFPRP